MKRPPVYRDPEGNPPPTHQLIMPEVLAPALDILPLFADQKETEEK